MAFFRHFFSLSLGLATVLEWLFTSLNFLVLPDARVGCTRSRRERASVSPRSSRLYPARTVRWAPHRFRPLESPSCTRPMPLGNRKSRNKDCSGVLRIRARFSFFALPSPFLAVSVRSNPRVALLQG